MDLELEGREGVRIAGQLLNPEVSLLLRGARPHFPRRCVTVLISLFQLLLLLHFLLLLLFMKQLLLKLLLLKLLLLKLLFLKLLLL